MTTTLCRVISYQWFSDGLSANLIFLISYYSNQLILPSTPDIFLLLLNTNTTCNWFLSLNVSVHSYTGYSITSNCPAENINQSNRDTWDFMLKLLCRVNLLRRRNNPEYKSRHFSHKMSQIERMTFAAIRIIMQNQLIKWLRDFGRYEIETGKAALFATCSRDVGILIQVFCTKVARDKSHGCWIQLKIV